MKLLIAEDDLTSRTMLNAMAKKWGYDPIAVEDGELAWEVFQQAESPKLLLIDWEMPNLDGLGLCRRIAECASIEPPYIILLTARNDVKDIVNGLDSGANDYIAKPYDQSELKARLQSGKRMLELQAELKKAKEELTFERETIEDIILKMRSSKVFYDRDLRCLEEPVEKTSGDVLLSANKPDGTRHIMLGDFTGHGLMAAVCGPIVFDIFYTMTEKGLPLSEIAGEINRQLLEKMPTGLFLGVILLEFSCHSMHLKVLNCGMSEVLIYRGDQLWRRIQSSMLALGIIPQDFNEAETLELSLDDHVYAYSDGITEVVNQDEEEFGQFRLESSIAEMLQSRAEITFLSQAVLRFRGQAQQADDITLVELSCADALAEK